MATLVAQKMTLTGPNPLNEIAADVGGDEFPNDGSTFVVLFNGDASPTTVTFDDSGSVAPPASTAFDADVAVSIAAGERAVFGPFEKGRFTRMVQVAYSSVTALTVGVVNY